MVEELTNVSFNFHNRIHFESLKLATVCNFIGIFIGWMKAQWISERFLTSLFNLLLVEVVTAAWFLYGFQQNINQRSKCRVIPRAKRYNRFHHILPLHGPVPTSLALLSLFEIKAQIYHHNLNREGGFITATAESWAFFAQAFFTLPGRFSKVMVKTSEGEKGRSRRGRPPKHLSVSEAPTASSSTLVKKSHKKTIRKSSAYISFCSLFKHVADLRPFVMTDSCYFSSTVPKSTGVHRPWLQEQLLPHTPGPLIGHLSDGGQRNGRRSLMLMSYIILQVISNNLAAIFKKSSQWVMEDMLDSDDNKSAEVDVPRQNHKAMHIFKKKN